MLPYLDELFITPTISGCFLMCRTEKLIGIGGFDGRFFMYMEDVDLCRRLWSVGMIACLPTVAVFHGYAAGSYKNLKLLRYHVQSAICYFRKWGIFPDRELNSINKLAGRSLDITDLD